MNPVFVAFMCATLLATLSFYMGLVANFPSIREEAVIRLRAKIWHITVAYYVTFAAWYGLFAITYGISRGIIK